MTVPAPCSVHVSTGVPPGVTAMAGVRGSAWPSIVCTSGPIRSWMAARGALWPASCAIATITCVPSARSLRVIDAPEPIAPCRLDTQLIDDATFPCSGSTAVAVSVTLSCAGRRCPRRDS